MNYLYCFFYWTGDHLVLHGLTHSFPTRRSSDRLNGTTAAVPAPSAGHPQGAPATADDRTDEPGGTRHMVIVDARGNAVSITTTIESYFGSGRMVDGFFLNNQLTAFSWNTATGDRKSTRLNSSH